MRQPPLDELLAIARTELRTNPTITVYTMRNGVEQLRLADPMARLDARLSSVNAASAELAAAAERVSVVARRIPTTPQQLGDRRT